eukprot:1195600-Prorocentrum_minimum.AAC.3
MGTKKTDKSLPSLRDPVQKGEGLGPPGKLNRHPSPPLLPKLDPTVRAGPTISGMWGTLLLITRAGRITSTTCGLPRLLAPPVLSR